MKLNQACKTVTLPSPSRTATQVYTELCQAYQNNVQAHNWLVVFDAAWLNHVTSAHVQLYQATKEKWTFF